MVAAVNGLADEIAKDLSGRFRVAYQVQDQSPTGLPTVYVEGPEDFIEHGGLVLLLDGTPKWLCKSRRFDSKGRLELNGPRKFYFVRTLFERVVEDTTFYLATWRSGNARYLTDRPGEALLLDGLEEESASIESSDAMRKYFSHSVPLLSDVPLATLLRIRREQRDEFYRYREAVERALRQVLATKRRIDVRDAQELGRSIATELAALRRELLDEHWRQTKRYGSALALLVAAVAIGAFGVPVAHLAPAVATGAAAVTGAAGGRVLGKAIESSCEQSTATRRSSDFYFLLRLTKALGKHT
jgi:hypothetical protein